MKTRPISTEPLLRYKCHASPVSFSVKLFDLFLPIDKTVTCTSQLWNVRWKIDPPPYPLLYRSNENLNKFCRHIILLYTATSAILHVHSLIERRDHVFRQIEKSASFDAWQNFVLVFQVCAYCTRDLQSKCWVIHSRMVNYSHKCFCIYPFLS